MEAIKHLLESSIWNGVQGILAVVMAIFYFIEKKDTVISTSKFVANTVLLFLAGVLPVAIFLEAISWSIYAVAGKGALDTSEKIVAFFMLIFLIAAVPSVAPTLAVMSSSDENIARKRVLWTTFSVGIIGGAITFSYLYSLGSIQPGQYVLLLVWNILVQIAWIGVCGGVAYQCVFWARKFTDRQNS